MAKDLEKDLEVEEKYENQKTEIIELLRQKEIEVQDLVIKKDNRFLIEIYLDEILETAKEVRDLEPDEYISRVFPGVYDNIEEIDGIISENSVGWSIKRISKTALCILRLAIYEMKYFDEIPVSVSINEAVELCKKYATNDDASFVNGILATVSKSL